jgi:hypothetical protein
MSGPNTSKTSQEQRQAPGASSPLSEQPALSGSWDALLALQNAAGNRAVGRLLRDGAAGSGGDGAGRNGGPGVGANRAPVSIQRKPADGHENSQAELQSDQAAEKAVESQEAEATARPLIVEDNVTRLEQGQMRKSDFLDQLHTSVCGAAEQALAGTMWSAMGCPYIDRWFSHYSGQNSQYVERALRKYAPETAGAGSARDYISIVTERVRRGVGQWKETGETTGVPEELAQGGMPGMTATGLIGGLVGGALSAVGGAISGLVSGAGQALSGIGQMLFKGREGGARGADDPAAIQSQLGHGHSLDSGVKTRMEGAYGLSFSDVRVHTDAKAKELSDGLNARAFTVGKDVAFGAGEYQPGTLIGDALIAHELAHVTQQSGANANVMQKGAGAANNLEEDADVSAVNAMVSIWGGKDSGLEGQTQSAMPRLRFGLGLQRCGKSPTKPGPNYSEGCSSKQIETLSSANSLAQIWIGAAVSKVDALLAGQTDPQTLHQLKTHFHIKDVTKSMDQVAKVRQGLAAIQRAFSGPVPFKCESEEKGGGQREADGGCLEGGGTPVAEVPGVPSLKFGLVGDIHIYPGFFEDVLVSGADPLATEQAKIPGMALEERAAIVIHEMAHKYLHADDKEYFKGCHSRQYAGLSTDDALDNADSYAQFTRFVQ